MVEGDRYKICCAFRKNKVAFFKKGLEICNWRYMWNICSGTAENSRDFSWVSFRWWLHQNLGRKDSYSRQISKSSVIGWSPTKFDLRYPHDDRIVMILVINDVNWYFCRTLGRSHTLSNSSLQKTEGATSTKRVQVHKTSQFNFYIKRCSYWGCKRDALTI